MNVNRDEFLEEGYIILRNVVPPDQLEGLRRAYETLIDRQRKIWTAQGSTMWETSAQPRLNLSVLADQIDAETAGAVEFWSHENMHGVSGRLLDVDDAAVTEMIMMCSPISDHGTEDHRGWHRDFYPPHSAPLQGYTEDIIENGPRYVQWNVPLYDDDVLWVVPGSHKRLNTDKENEQLNENDRVPPRGAVQTHLKAGDGVIYILPLLHWGSEYNAKMRRTIHGGFSVFTYYDDVSFIEHISAKSRQTFERWDRRSKTTMGHAESALRAALHKDAAGYHAALDKLHPGRGEKGNRQSTIFLSKTAKRIGHLTSPDFDQMPALDRDWAMHKHPITLYWGQPLANRFSPQEAATLWARFKPVDDAMQAPDEQFTPGFGGGPTRYYFNEVPADLTVESFIAGWRQ